ncbi:MAG: hypothetical protein SGPRY_008995 [Prymnesium sp.]
MPSSSSSSMGVSTGSMPGRMVNETGTTLLLSLAILGGMVRGSFWTARGEESVPAAAIRAADDDKRMAATAGRRRRQIALTAAISGNEAGGGSGEIGARRSPDET